MPRSVGIMEATMMDQKVIGIMSPLRYAVTRHVKQGSKPIGIQDLQARYLYFSILTSCCERQYKTILPKTV